MWTQTSFIFHISMITWSISSFFISRFGWHGWFLMVLPLHCTVGLFYLWLLLLVGTKFKKKKKTELLSDGLSVSINTATENEVMRSQFLTIYLLGIRCEVLYSKLSWNIVILCIIITGWTKISKVAACKPPI